MGRQLQKKKNRSSLPRVRQKPKRTHYNVKSNEIVAANWNPKQTVTQNYRRLGLTSRLKASTGGIEKQPTSSSAHSRSTHTPSTSLAIPTNTSTTLQPREIKVQRDPVTGAITKILKDDDDTQRAKHKRSNPLNDPLADILSDSDSDSESGAPTQNNNVTHKDGNGHGIVPQLERAAAAAARAPEPRYQSQREREWIEALVAKYGDDWGKMARDRQLNPMQAGEGELRRRVKIWRNGQEREKVRERLEVGNED